jgi:basic amino acid/polyamine antiporter, APA family
VLAMYILANFVYLTVLPLRGDPNGTTVLARGIQFAQEDRVGTAVLQQIFHSAGAYVMAGAILISTFGCANGLVLAGARVYYAMSKDGLFFKAAGELHPRSKVPVASLVVQCVWTSLLCISGSYGQLLDYTIFAALLFYILTIGSLFVLRLRQPNAPRPYRAFGYPVLPALYIVMAIWISAVLLRYKPQYTWPGLAIVLCGIPVYLIWSARNRNVAS